MKKVVKDQSEKSAKNGVRVVMNEIESQLKNFEEKITPEPKPIENISNTNNNLPKIESTIQPVEETPKKKSQISFIENEKR